MVLLIVRMVNVNLKNRRRQRGPAFTLVELLAVVLVIAVLSALGMGVFSIAQRRAAATRCRSEMQVIMSGIEVFKLDNGLYPTTTTARVGANITFFPDATLTTNNFMLYQQLVPSGGRPYVQFKASQLLSPGRYSIGSITNYVLSNSTVVIDAYYVQYGYFNPVGPSVAKSNLVAYDFWSWGPTANSCALNADSIVNWGHKQ